MVEEMMKPKWNNLGELERNYKLRRNIKWLESSTLKRSIREDFETIEELAILLFYYTVAVYTPKGSIATAEGRYKSIEGAYLTVKSYFKDATVEDLIKIKDNLIKLGLINNQWCPTVRKYTHYGVYASDIFSPPILWHVKTFSEIFELYKDKYELLKLKKS